MTLNFKKTFIDLSDRGLHERPEVRFPHERSRSILKWKSPSTNYFFFFYLKTPSAGSALWHYWYCWHFCHSSISKPKMEFQLPHFRTSLPLMNLGSGRRPKHLGSCHLYLVKPTWSSWLMASSCHLALETT